MGCSCTPACCGCGPGPHGLEAALGGKGEGCWGLNATPSSVAPPIGLRLVLAVMGPKWGEG